MLATRQPPVSAVRGLVRPVSVAPMMQCTDRHFRFLMRQITRHTLLYTEMVTTGAVLHGDRDRLLGFSEVEHPVALQLGGDDPAALAACARIAAERGYDEVNLNVGCPSDRVQDGNFGACLMARPEVVARCVEAMREAVDLPVTVKHRIGIDAIDQYEDMLRFVRIVAEAGADRFTVHARKAWLQGLSPRENREVPPLRYEEVHRLKAELPHLVVEINGGIRRMDEVEAQLAHVDAVMIGRGAYDDPLAFATADRRFFADPAPAPTRREVVERMLPYVEAHVTEGDRLHRVARHMLTLFAGQPGTRAWKRHLSENATRPGAGPEVIEAALARVPSEVLDARPGDR